MCCSLGQTNFISCCSDSKKQTGQQLLLKTQLYTIPNCVCSCKQSIIAKTKAKQKEKAITIVFNNARQCNSILKIIKIVYINKLLKSDIYQNK